MSFKDFFLYTGAGIAWFWLFLIVVNTILRITLWYLDRQESPLERRFKRVVSLSIKRPKD